jgi:hypothetical protein
MASKIPAELPARDADLQPFASVPASQQIRDIRLPSARWSAIAQQKRRYLRSEDALPVAVLKKDPYLLKRLGSFYECQAGKAL